MSVVGGRGHGSRRAEPPDEALVRLVHEIRQPLAAIAAIASTARDDPFLSEAARELFARIEGLVAAAAITCDDAVPLPPRVGPAGRD